MESDENAVEYVTAKGERTTSDLHTRDGLDPARQAFLNGCVNFAKGLLNVAVIVMLTPILLSHLGSEAFGVWSLLGLFVTYVALIDLGVSGAVAKLISELSPTDDSERFKRLLTSAICLAGILMSSTAFLVLVFRHRLEALLALFGLFEENAKVFLVGAVALYSVGLLSNMLLYVLLGLHRLDVANYIAGCVLLIQAAGTVVVLRAGFGLPGLIALMIATSALSIVAYFLSFRRLAPAIRFRLSGFSLSTVKRIMILGFYLQVYALVGVYYFYVGKAVVSLRFPLAMVAAYEVALRLPILFRQGVLAALGPMMPAVSCLHAQGAHEQVRTLLTRAFRYTILLGTPVFVGTAVFAEPIIRLWVGPGFPESVLPLRILSIALGLSVFPDLAWYFLVGLGRQRLAMIFSLVVVIVGTVLSYVLAARWELAGVAFGVLLTSVFGAIAFAWLLAREGMLPFSGLSLPVGFKTVAIASLVYITALILAGELQPGYWSLSSAFILASAAYYLWVVKGGVLEERERLFLRRYIPTSLGFLC